MPYKNKEDKQARNKRYYIENRDKIIQYQKQYYLNNKEKINEHRRNCYYKDNRKHLIGVARQYYIDNPERVKTRVKEWNKNHPEKVREYNRNYDRKMYKINPKHKINAIVSSRINKTIKKTKNHRKWETLVGYTINDLVKRLNSTMPEGYDWDDYLEGKLQIDHIIPISAFNYTNPEHIDFKRCWALDNLRLLSAKDNNTKSDKIIKSFQTALMI